VPLAKHSPSSERQEEWKSGGPAAPSSSLETAEACSDGLQASRDSDSSLGQLPYQREAKQLRPHANRA